MVVHLVGCSTVPQNGSVLNRKVSEGINKNQIEVAKIIKALADVERNILNEEWDNIYAKVENKYMVKHAIVNAAFLTQDQRRAIAANAAETYHNLLSDIKGVEETLQSQTQANANILIEINDEVTKYLLSTEKFDEATNNIKNKIAGLLGLDLTSLSGLAKKLVGRIN
jgi:hypothetical protein